MKPDLSTLGVSELNDLITQAQARLQEVRLQERKDALKELKDSGRLKELRDEWQKLGKEGKKLAKTASFDLLLPLRFSVTEGPYATDLFRYDEEDYEDPSCLFGCFTATIKKDENLTQKQRNTLKATVQETVEGACEEIWDIVPADFRAQFETFSKKVAAFVKKAKAAKLSEEDLR